MCHYEDLPYGVALAPALFPVINRYGSEQSPSKMHTDYLMAAEEGLMN